jgi:hypothetical protein
MNWSWLLSLLMYVMFLACVGFCLAEGMWSNALRLINVVTAALLAMTFFEPLAKWLDTQSSSYTYWWDFLALWGIFSLSLALLRAVTDQVSRVKVKFLAIVDRIGSVVLSIAIGWVMVCFIMMTLHTAPMSKTYLAGSFDYEKYDALLWTPIGNMAPDKMWLSFTQKMSKGTYCRALSGEEAKKYWFDESRTFRQKYAKRREELQNRILLTNSARVGN